jgi:tetratricopeptide (TPR) repeat protein
MTILFGGVDPVRRFRNRAFRVAGLFTLCFMCKAASTNTPVQVTGFNGAAIEPIDLAERLHDEHKFAEAKTILLGALEDALKHQNGKRRIAYIFDSLGSVAQDQGQYLEAEKYYRRSIDYWQDGGEKSLAGLARTLNNLASLLYSAGKLGEAQQLLRRSEDIQLEGDPEAGVVLLNRGSAYFGQRKYDEAEAAYRGAWAALEPHGKSREPQLAVIAADLGLICEKTGRREEAQSHYTFARTVWEKQVQSGKATPEMFLSLAELYSTLRQDVSAKLVLQKGLVVAERELGPEHPLVAEMLFLYARVLRQSGSKAEAARMAKRATAIRAQSQERLARHTISVADLAPEGRTK